MMQAASSDKLTDKYYFYRVILHIIPVIDCLNGICVHAKKGQRSRYQPISSGLTKSSQPLDIVKAFMDVYPFKTLYIADLNAIQTLENTGEQHTDIIAAIKQEFPQLKLWIDAGVNTIEQAERLQSLDVQLALGSESFQTIAQYTSLTKKLDAPFTLSLDFFADGYAGPNQLLAQMRYWPIDIIIMTLAKVGANTGVDLNTIKSTMQQKGKQHFYAAGGIRHLNDLQQLKSLKVKGALVASALHNKSLTTRALERLATSR